MSGTVILADRSANGISVELAYDFTNCEASVHVKSPSDDFTLYPPNPVALDCYWHPYAYASRVLARGTFAEVA